VLSFCVQDWTFQEGESAFEAEIFWNRTAYLVWYRPLRSGVHNLSATFSNESSSFHIRGSPFQLIIYPSANVSSRNSMAKGDGLTLSTAGIRSFFSITVRDRWGGLQYSDAPSIGVFVHGHHLPLEYMFEGMYGIGMFSVSYIPKVVGEFPLKICSLSENGLLAEYFADTSFLTKTLSRVDGEIDFTWHRGRPGADLFLEARKPSLSFAVRWRGYVSSALDQIHTFGIHVLERDERVRLWLDDVLLVDQVLSCLYP
jgi:hypothetical protein